jgi:hypothetical protein
MAKAFITISVPLTITVDREAWVELNELDDGSAAAVRADVRRYIHYCVQQLPLILDTGAKDE